MAFLRSVAGRTHWTQQQPDQPRADEPPPPAATRTLLLPPHFVLDARGINSNAAASGAAAAAGNAGRLPSSVGLLRFPSADAKLQHWQQLQQQRHYSSHVSDTPRRAASAGPVLLPHMDDLEEEIALLGYEKAMVAGASAGVTEHVFMFPVDTVKTRMQALQRPSQWRKRETATQNQLHTAESA
jgi:hypothetical protein